MNFIPFDLDMENSVKYDSFRPRTHLPGCLMCFSCVTRITPGPSLFYFKDKPLERSHLESGGPAIFSDEQPHL